jgi:putative ABC transport system substrate-binding protein
VDRRAFISGVTFGLFATPLAAEGQQATRVPRVGYLGLGSPSDPFIQAFQQGLRELGYVEGQNIVLEYRYAQGHEERLPALATELVRLKVDVIVAVATSGAQAARQATRTIPIVMLAVGDPGGFVASLARPGGNLTGLSTLGPDLAGKRLQLLIEVTPGLSRVAVLWNPLNSFSVLIMRQTEAAARMLGTQLQSLEVRVPDDFDNVFRAATRGRAGALIAAEDSFIFTHRNRIVEFAARNGLPSMSGYRGFVEAGGLMSYGPSLLDLAHRAPIYVDKILKGAKPGDLPVEQPTKFELVINFKTAKALGLTIPPSLLARADEIIQ